MEFKVLDKNEWYKRGNIGTSGTLDVYESLSKLDEILCEADSALQGSGIGTLNYSSQSSDIEKIRERLCALYIYITELPHDIDKLIDEIVYKDFNKNATETITQVYLADITTKNLIGLKVQQTVSGGGRIYESVINKPELSIKDFLGNDIEELDGNSYVRIKRIDCVESFANLFKEDYNKYVNKKDFTLEEYLDEIMEMGEIKEIPFHLKIISSILDCTIIIPIIDAIRGYDCVTKEKLTGFQRGMKAVFAVVDVATLGASMFARKGAKLGGKAVVRIIATEFAANAVATTIGCVGNELGLPVGVTMLLSMLGGSYVGIKGSKWVFKTVDGRTFKLADEAIEGISKNLDEVAEGVGKAELEVKPFTEVGKLKPNIKYKTGEYDYLYETDVMGRISKFETDNLKLTKRESRLQHNPDTPGKLDGDHAGHLAGDRFGGSPELDNLVSQASNVNLSKYKKIENEWATAIKEGKQVKVNVEIKYNGDGLRPSEFNVQYEIDGKYFERDILN